MAILSNSWTQHLKSRAGNDETNKNMKAFSERGVCPRALLRYLNFDVRRGGLCPDGLIVPAVFRVLFIIRFLF